RALARDAEVPPADRVRGDLDRAVGAAEDDLVAEDERPALAERLEGDDRRDHASRAERVRALPERGVLLRSQEIFERLQRLSALGALDHQLDVLRPLVARARASLLALLGGEQELEALDVAGGLESARFSFLVARAGVSLGGLERLV